MVEASGRSSRGPSIEPSRALASGRAAFSRCGWGDAYRHLTAADSVVPLDAEDLDLLATAAHLTGRDGEAADVRARAHQEYLKRGELERAAQSAFWLGFHLVMGGEAARGGGWLARAQRVLDEGAPDSVVSGYLLLPQAIRAAGDGDVASASAKFGEALETGVRFGDKQLMTLARMGQGRAQVRAGRIAEGMSLLDEVMVAVTAGEVSPIVAGGVYCSVLDACHEVLDVRRAQEWTDALSRWCASQQDLVPYRGECLVRRAEILQLHGAWSDAMDAAAQACERPSTDRRDAASGAAFYQQAELHRLRGAFDKAAEAYRLANQHGYQPQPGLALLRLAQRQTEAAAAAIRHFLDEPHKPPVRARALAAHVEIMIAANDAAAARGAADELAAISASRGGPYLRALSQGAAGAVLLAEGQPQAAIAALRDAQTAWAEVGAPFEEARVGVLLGIAHRALGDEDTARMELEAARGVFQPLDAQPDLARVSQLLSASRERGSNVLTSRESEVLRMLATGKTNRAIAQHLGISEKTVARHVSNIFSKLDVSSRAAATAYAYRRRLV